MLFIAFCCSFWFLGSVSICRQLFFAVLRCLLFLKNSQFPLKIKLVSIWTFCALTARFGSFSSDNHFCFLLLFGASCCFSLPVVALLAFHCSLCQP